MDLNPETFRPLVQEELSMTLKAKVQKMATNLVPPTYRDDNEELNGEGLPQEDRLFTRAQGKKFYFGVGLAKVGQEVR